MAVLGSVSQADTIDQIDGRVQSIALSSHHSVSAIGGVAQGDITFLGESLIANPNLADDLNPTLSARHQLFVFLQNGKSVSRKLSFPIARFANVIVESVAIGEQGNVAIAGSFSGNVKFGDYELRSTGSRDGFVLLLDDQLRVISVNASQSTSYDVFTDIDSSPTGFVAAGYSADGSIIGNSAKRFSIQSQDDSHVVGVVSALNRDGRLSWVTTLDSPIIGRVSVNQLGDVAVSGWFYERLKSQALVLESRGRASTFVLRLHPDGTPLWLRSLGGRSECDEFVSRLLMANDRKIYISGTYCGVGLYANEQLPRAYYGNFLSAIDGNGNVSWIRQLIHGSTLTNGGYPWVRSLLETPDNKLVMVAGVGPGARVEQRPIPNQGDIDSVLLVADKTGRIEHIETLGSPDFDEPLDLSLVGEQSNRLRLLSRTDGTAIRDIALSRLTGQAAISLSNSLTPETTALDRMLNYVEPKHYLKDVRQSFSPSDTENYLILHFKGIGYSHALISLIAFDSTGEPPVNFSLLASYGLWTENQLLGVDASLGMALSGDTAADYVRYIDGLTLSVGKPANRLAEELLTAKSTKILLRVDESQKEAVLAALVELSTMPDLTFVQQDDLALQRTFLDATNDRFRHLLSILNIKYERNFSRDFPQQVWMWMPYEQNMTETESWRRANGLLNYQLLAEDAFEGDTQAGLAHGLGEVTFSDRTVLYPDGRSLRWRHYEGAFQQGFFHGVGKLTFDFQSNPQSTVECRMYQGNFVQGLPQGDGEISGCDDSLIYTKGTFERGGLNDGVRHVFDSLGRRIAEWNVVAGLRHGEVRRYDADRQTLVKRANYVAGVLHGKFIDYYPVSGQIKRLMNYQNGIAIGAVRYFFYDGLIRVEPEKTYIDVKLPASKKQLGDGTWLYEGYELFDIYGRGSLTYVYDGSYSEPDFQQVISEGKAVVRRFVYQNGDVHVVQGDDSTYYYKDGSVLISQYGLIEGRISENHHIQGGEPHIWRRTALELKGRYMLVGRDGGILNGTIKNGWLNGQASYRTPKGDDQIVNVVDGSWSWSWEELVRVKKRGVLRRIGRELGRWGDDVVHIVDQAGEEFEDFICGLVGKEPGDNCGVAGGAQCDTNGNCTATDGAGDPVDVPPPQSNIIPANEVMGQLDLDGISDAMVDGLWRLVVSTEAELGLPWPGMVAGESIIAPGAGKVRKSDSYGVGAFWESRRRRTSNSAGETVTVEYRHRGGDYIVVAGEEVFAPVTGFVVRVTDAYSSDGHGLKAIVIKSDDYEAKILYVRPDALIGPGSFVVAGETKLGSAQAVSAKYPGITDHVHIQIQDPQGRYYPPTGELPLRHLQVLRINN